MMTRAAILVVEDNPVMAEGIYDVLEVEGYNVIMACNGREALECLDRHRVDLILADIMMPLMDGYELYEKVRERHEWMAIPFVFLTARGQKEEIRQGKKLGVDDYLVKPFDPDDLAVVVEAKLRRALELEQVGDQRLDSLKRGILNALSHEFRTPLTYIQGYTDLLIDSDPANEPGIYKEFLERIRGGSERILALVEDFVFLISLEAGEVAHAVSEGGIATDLLPTLRATVSAFEEQVAQRGTVLHTEWPSDLPRVLAFVPYLADALERLLDNAIKFSPPEDGEVWVSAREIDGQVRISIRDNGRGIPLKEHERIFDRFYQVDRGLYEQQGVGLGLSIVKSIIELHQGTVEVGSVPGEGSTFTVVLPVADEL